MIFFPQKKTITKVKTHFHLIYKMIPGELKITTSYEFNFQGNFFQSFV